MSRTPNTKHGGPRQRPDVIDEIHEEYLSTYPSFISRKQQASPKLQATSSKVSSTVDHEASGTKSQA